MDTIGSCVFRIQIAARLLFFDISICDKISHIVLFSSGSFDKIEETLCESMNLINLIIQRMEPSNEISQHGRLY